MCRKNFCSNIFSNEKHNTSTISIYPSKKNWPSGKEWSTLVSDIIKILSILISILSLITSAKKSNLFRIELIFRRAKISLLRLSLRIVCSLEFVQDFAFSECQMNRY